MRSSHQVRALNAFVTGMDTDRLYYKSERRKAMVCLCTVLIKIFLLNRYILTYGTHCMRTATSPLLHARWPGSQSPSAADSLSAARGFFRLARAGSEQRGWVHDPRHRGSLLAWMPAMLRKFGVWCGEGAAGVRRPTCGGGLAAKNEAVPPTVRLPLRVGPPRIGPRMGRGSGGTAPPGPGAGQSSIIYQDTIRCADRYYKSSALITQ